MTFLSKLSRYANGASTYERLLYRIRTFLQCVTRVSSPSRVALRGVITVPFGISDDLLVNPIRYESPPAIHQVMFTVMGDNLGHRLAYYYALSRTGSEVWAPLSRVGLM